MCRIKKFQDFLAKMFIECRIEHVDDLIIKNYEKEFKLLSPIVLHRSTIFLLEENRPNFIYPEIKIEFDI